MGPPPHRESESPDLWWGGTPPRTPPNPGEPACRGAADSLPCSSFSLRWSLK